MARQTNSLQVGSLFGRPSIFLSHTLRGQEKAELQNLNGCLGAYIDKVRCLTQCNNNLRRKVQCWEAKGIRDVTSLKSVFHEKLTDVKNIWKETAKQKEKLKIDRQRLLEENGTLQTKLREKSRDLLYAVHSDALCVSRFNHLTKKYNQVADYSKKVKKELKFLQKECERLHKQKEGLYNDLKGLALTLVDLKGTQRSMREESLRSDVEKLLQELRCIKPQIEVSEIDGRFIEQYEARLHDFREQYKTQALIYRKEIEILKSEINKLVSQSKCISESTAALSEDLRHCHFKISKLVIRISEMESANLALMTLLKGLKNLVRVEKIRNAEGRQLLEDELRALREKIVQVSQKYQDLMDCKVALDMELHVYRKLLECEEARLNTRCRTPIHNI